MVAAKLQALGCEGIHAGVENESDAARGLLYRLLRAARDADDFGANYWRPWAELFVHVPDWFWWHPKAGYFRVDVKYRNGSRLGIFTVDANALFVYRGMHLAHTENPTETSPVVLAFVELQTGEMWCCYADQIPVDTVYVPNRNPDDFAYQCRRVREDWPSARLVPRPFSGGSGNPYVRVSDSSPLLIPIDQFVEQDLFSRVDAGVACTRDPVEGAGDLAYDPDPGNITWKGRLVTTV
jgi:hypothetical protein